MRQDSATPTPTPEQMHGSVPFTLKPETAPPTPTPVKLQGHTKATKATKAKEHTQQPIKDVRQVQPHSDIWTGLLVLLISPFVIALWVWAWYRKVRTTLGYRDVTIHHKYDQ